jgi:hypothetical protein
MNVLKSLALTVTLVITTSSSALAQDATNIKLVEATKKAYCSMASIAYGNDPEAAKTYELIETCAKLDAYLLKLKAESKEYTQAKQFYSKLCNAKYQKSMSGKALASSKIYCSSLKKQIHRHEVLSR